MILDNPPKREEKLKKHYMNIEVIQLLENDHFEQGTQSLDLLLSNPKTDYIISLNNIGIYV